MNYLEINKFLNGSYFFNGSYNDNEAYMMLIRFRDYYFDPEDVELLKSINKNN